MVQPALCGRCGAPLAAGADACAFCGVGFVGPDGPARGAAAPGVDHDVVELLRKGDKVGAIKAYRERHKSSLGGAKDAVEKLQEPFGIRID